jgi:hypothetical protein
MEKKEYWVSRIFLNTAPVKSASRRNLRSTQTTGYPAKHVRDLRSEQQQDRDHNDGNQDENQRVLNETLAFFFGQVQHPNHLLSVCLAAGLPRLQNQASRFAKFACHPTQSGFAIKNRGTPKSYPRSVTPLAPPGLWRPYCKPSIIAPAKKY